ncbi:hypothetical protein [Desulfuromonas sp. DDH964]|uniref:hypothetical protein n=1 Tax=Desulfuromonas sp. DDH964 TaxID=1823759 RepID=UPI00078E28FD|nr:hypothetical protein [Desulfuromonas sp. DDH964]AMV72995.1 hypothetical protein DBW_2671 [Desulfuromonas sp. DDH964]
MSKDSLDQFTRQLARWAEEQLERSRSPLRRIDLSPRVLTPQGALYPDLVLWINRDSGMAGGVILVPPRESDCSEEQGRLCAHALGLRHFVVWGADEIVFWEILPGGLSRHRTVAAPPAGSDATSFRHTLATVLEEIKYLTVAGSLTPEELPPHYLVNLCLGGLAEVVPGLKELMRVACSEGRCSATGVPPEQQAQDKAFLTLVRIAALLHLDQLPTAVQPEGLERAMLFAIDTLPAELRKALAPLPGEFPLPLDIAVRFHHLSRRLAQLGGCQDSQRLARVLELLREDHQLPLGQHALTAPVPKTRGPRLIANLANIPPGPEDWEVAPPSLLACSVLLRHLQGQPAARIQAADPFQLPGTPAPTLILAALTSPTTLPARERAALQAGLRISWPTRRFRLPPDLPRWGWELLHLAGLAAREGKLRLKVPGDWLSAPFADVLLDTLREDFSIGEIRRISAHQMEIDLCKDGGADSTCLVNPGRDNRYLEGELSRKAPALFWALALDLPDPVWTLFENGHLHLDPSGNSPQDLEAGVNLFVASSLGRLLWQVAGNNQPLPGPRRFAATWGKRPFPLPNRDILTLLQRLAEEHPATPSTAEIDAELAPWFALPLSATGRVANHQEPMATAAAATPTPTLDLADLSNTLYREVFSDGLPLFPEHYLFDHFRPELQEYRLSLPLQRGEPFFGRVVLTGADGDSFEVSSELAAQAVELAAAAGREVVLLPADPLILQNILGRYLQDLQTLHEALLRRAHLLLTNPRQARAVAGKLWERLPLPPPEFFRAKQR